MVVWYPGERLTDSEAATGLSLVVGGLTGSAGEIGAGHQVVAHQGVLPGGGPGQGLGDRPAAALPAQGKQGVLVPGRLQDLQHHLVPLQLAGDAGLVGLRQPAPRGVARTLHVAVTRVLHTEPWQIFLLLQVWVS